MKKKYLIAIILLAFSVYMGCKKDDNNNGGGDGNPPISNFEANITICTAPFTIIFTDQSYNNPTSWQWDFGDYSTSTQASPSHTYNKVGSYDVVLTVTNAYGSDTEIKPEYIYVGSSGEPCPGIPTVTYEGQVYNTVLIGSQCWFKENLNVGTMINGSEEMKDNSIIEKYCYDNDPANCEIYGGLYQWNEMMEYSTTAGVQGICPGGWHSSTYVEWTILIDFLGGESVAGGKIKESGTIHWQSPNTGTNESGFTALPGGCRYPTGGFFLLIYTAFTWSSSGYGSPEALYQYLSHDHDKVYRFDRPKNFGFSVRCLKD